MAAVILAVADEALDVVLHTAGVSLVLTPRLDGHGGRSLLRHFEREGIGVGAELLDEPLLQLGGMGIVRGWVDLLRGEEQIFLEAKAHNLVLLATIPEAADQLAEHLAALQVRWLDHQHAI